MRSSPSESRSWIEGWVVGIGKAERCGWAVNRETNNGFVITQRRLASFFQERLHAKTAVSSRIRLKNSVREPFKVYYKDLFRNGHNTGSCFDSSVYACETSHEPMSSDGRLADTVLNANSNSLTWGPELCYSTKGCATYKHKGPILCAEGP